MLHKLLLLSCSSANIYVVYSDNWMTASDAKYCFTGVEYRKLKDQIHQLFESTNQDLKYAFLVIRIWKNKSLIITQGNSVVSITVVPGHLPAENLSTGHLLQQWLRRILNTKKILRQHTRGWKLIYAKTKKSPDTDLHEFLWRYFEHTLKQLTNWWMKPFFLSRK